MRNAYATLSFFHSFSGAPLFATQNDCFIDIGIKNGRKANNSFFKKFYSLRMRQSCHKTPFVLIFLMQKENRLFY